MESANNSASDRNMTEMSEQEGEHEGEQREGEQREGEQQEGEHRGEHRDKQNKHSKGEHNNKGSFDSNSHKRGRGRPRKNQVINIIDTKKKNTQHHDIKNLFNFDENRENDDIILHLPITLNDIDKIKHKQNSNIFEKIDNSKIHPVSNTNETINIFTINDINSDDTMSTDDYSQDDVNNDLFQKMKDQEKYIKKLETEIHEYKHIIQSTIDNNGMNLTKVNRMKTDFVFIDDSTKKQIIIEKTEIACWWCTYNFDSVPCFIPEKYIDEKYHVFGCFCSYNCALSYNLNMNDYNVGNRHSLLKRLHNTIYNSNEDIPLAPPKEVFEKFGGTLTYPEYRKNCQTNLKEYRFIMPPLISIIPSVEESTKNNMNINTQFSNLNQNLVLKRSKPIPTTKATLLESMYIAHKVK